MEETMWKTSEKNLFELLKEYDICPSLINKSIAFQIFQHTKNSNEAAYWSAGLDILAILA